MTELDYVTAAVAYTGLGLMGFDLSTPLSCDVHRARGVTEPDYPTAAIAYTGLGLVGFDLGTPLSCDVHRSRVQ